MKRISILLISLVCLNHSGFAQITVDPASFKGAPATLEKYKALYYINESEEKKVKGIIRNINNALIDPRLKGKLEVELVAFGDGVEIFKKSSNYDTLLLKLQSKGVILAQCENTVRERKIGKDQLWPFISYVPSGNGEIIIRQSEGWSVIHP